MENKHFALYRALCDSDEEKASEIMRSHLFTLRIYMALYRFLMYSNNIFII